METLRAVVRTKMKECIVVGWRLCDRTVWRDKLLMSGNVCKTIYQCRTSRIDCLDLSQTSTQGTYIDFEKTLERRLVLPSGWEGWEHEGVEGLASHLLASSNNIKTERGASSVFAS